MGATAGVTRPSAALMVNLVSQLAFGLLLMTVCIPSMQDWPAAFGASQAAVQLTFSAFVAPYGGLQLVYGPVSDRIGRKPVLLFGLGLAFGGTLLAALAPGLGVLTLARALQGAGCAAGMVVGRAMVQDLFEGPERTRMMAFIGMAMGLCPPLATLLGGHLHVRLGWQANFWLAACGAAVLWVAAWRGLPDRAASGQAAPPPGGWRALGRNYLRLLREPGFALYAGILASTTATFYCFLGGAPIVLGGYGVPPDRIGWFIMCVPLAYMAGNVLTTRLVRRHADRTIMAWGQTLNVGGLLLLLAVGLAGARSPFAMALPLMVLGVGHGLLAPPTLAGTVGLVPALAGSAAAVAGLVQQLTGAAAAFSVGLVPHQGQVNLALLMLGWTAIGVASQVLLGRTRRKSGPG